MINKIAVIFGMGSVICLAIAVILLAKISSEFARLETCQTNLAHTLSNALAQYEDALRVIERRQTHIENIITTGSQLRLTIEQLKAYNRFSVPSSVFARSKNRGSRRKKAIGGD